MNVELSGMELATIRISLTDKIEKMEKYIKIAEEINDNKSKEVFVQVRDNNKNILDRLYKI